MNDLPDGLDGYTPFEAMEIRVQHATEKLCEFDPDAAAYRQRTEAWVRLVLGWDDEREREGEALWPRECAPEEDNE